MRELSPLSQAIQWQINKRMFHMDNIYHQQGLNLMGLAVIPEQGKSGEVVHQTLNNNIRWLSDCNKLEIW